MSMRTIDGAVIAGVPLFAGLSREALDGIVAAATSRRLAKGSALFAQDEPATAFFVLVHGEVKVTQTTRDGQQVVVRYVGPGEFMGIAAVTAGAIYPATATAVVDSVVLSWSTAAIAAVIARHPQIAVSALGGVGGRLNEAHARLREMSTERVERRIAHALVRLVRQSGARTDEGIEIAFPISRQDIAEMTGTTLHTVSRTLAAWEGDGILAGGRQKIVIRDPHRLVTIAEDLPVAERQAHSPRADRRRA